MVEPKDIAMGFAHLVGVLFFLYFFLVSLSLLGGSFVVLAGDEAGSLFANVSNPLAALLVGILATVMVQSSSTTTSIVVTMAGTGIISVQQGIFLVMGANIGTSVTNTIVSLGFVADREQMRRGFAGATVHDCFNIIAVSLWLPLEWIGQEITGEFGPLGAISEAITDSAFEACPKGDPDCEKWVGPLKIITGEISDLILKADKDIVKDFAQGRPDLEWCNEFGFLKEVAKEGDVLGKALAYKFNRKKCADVNATGLTGATGICGEENVKKDAKATFKFCSDNGTSIANEATMLAAQKHYDSYKLAKGGVFVKAGLDDTGAGAVTLVLSIIFLMICLIGMVKVLTHALTGKTNEIARKILNMPGPLAIIAGALFTMFVQSSSITTSVLTPLVAIGTIELEAMLPLTLGANIGTTVTGILAALVSDKSLGFQVALVHVLFNVFSVCLLYPVPAIRRIPLKAASNLGDLAATFRGFPVVYLVTVFFLVPAILLGISLGLDSGSAGGVAGGVIGLLLFLGGIGGAVFWYTKKGGRELLVEKFGKTDEEYEAEAKAKGIVTPAGEAEP